MRNGLMAGWGCSSANRTTVLPPIPMPHLISAPDAARGHRLLEVVRHALRERRYRPRTAEAYVVWIRRFVVHHGRRHPGDMGEAEVIRAMWLLIQPAFAA